VSRAGSVKSRVVASNDGDGRHTAATVTRREAAPAGGVSLMRVPGTCTGSPSIARLTREASLGSKVGAAAAQRLADHCYRQALTQPPSRVKRFNNSSVLLGSSPSKNAETCSRICSLMFPLDDPGRHQNRS